jgi:hypothetical protein
MKTILTILSLCLVNYSVAQKNKLPEDNLFKTFPLNGAKTLALKVDNKNITIKTWKENTVKLSTYIKNEKNIDNYTFDAKIKGEIFKINASLKKNQNDDAVDNGNMINNARAIANADAQRKANNNHIDVFVKSNNKNGTKYNLDGKWYTLTELKNMLSKETNKSKRKSITTSTINGKTIVTVDGKVLDKINLDGIAEAEAANNENVMNDNGDEGATINYSGSYNNNFSGEPRNQNSNYSGEPYAYDNCGCDGANNLTLTIPENLLVRIDNNNGNISINDNLESLTIDSKNGNVTAQNINNLEAEATYTNFDLNEITNADMDLNGCNFTSGNIKNLLLDTKFGNYELESVQNFTLTNSQSDEFDINEVGNITGKFSFSNIKIQKLIAAIDLDITSGDIKVKNVTPSVTKININGKFTEIDVTLRNTSSYSINAKTIFSTIKSNGRYIESNNEEQEFKDNKGEANKTKITMTCNSCTVTLK